MRRNRVREELAIYLTVPSDCKHDFAMTEDLNGMAVFVAVAEAKNFRAARCFSRSICQALEDSAAVFRGDAERDTPRVSADVRGTW